MTTDSLHHSDFLQQIDAYLAGGLDPAERAAFEMHAAACEACAGVLEAARRSDQAIDQLFADVRPRADFEDRLIGRLRDLPRQGSQSRQTRSQMFRLATGIAAVLVLGGFGYVAQTVKSTGGLSFYASRAAEAPPASRLSGFIYDGYQASAPSAASTSTPAPAAAQDEGDSHLPEDPQRGWERGEKLGQDAPGIDFMATQKDIVAPEQMVRKFNERLLEEMKKTPESPGVEVRDNVFRATQPQPGQSRQQAAGQNSSGATETPKFQDASEAVSPEPAPRNRYFKPSEEARGNAAGGKRAEAGERVSGEKESSLPADDAPKTAAGPAHPNDPAATASPAAVQPAPAPAPAAAENLQPATRKVIRNGEMSFEVDSFDSALMQITKIAQEEGGFVSTTDSEKLPNGKVSGTVIVRVIPDRLDTLVLKFRGLGDLKSSRIAAQDITKHYTDLASQLRASRAMEERLLEIIKTGKGSIKELLAAEKELGVWREKIEKLEGEIRYYDNLVSLSTLSITLMERELRTAAMLSESETVQMGIEAEDVEKARTDAIAAIDAAKGRIVQSDLKQHDEGQYIAHIEAEVAPDAAGPLIDRLKQLGRIGRLEIQRRQTTPENAPPLANARVERNNTRLIISLYNVASIAPRETTMLTIASSDVADTFNTLRDAVHAANGRVLSTQLQEQDTANSSAQLDFEVRREDWAAVDAALRNAGQIMSRQVTRSADMENTVDSKIRLQVVFLDAAQLNPRETVTLQLAVSDVPEQFAKLAEVLREADARVIDSRLNEAEQHRMNGTLVFDIRRASRAAVDKALAEAGDVVSRNVMRSNDTQNTLDDKVRLSVSITDADHLPPRETTTLGLESKDVDQSLNQIKSTALALGGRVVDSTLSKEKSGRVMGKIVVDVPLNKSMEMLTKASDEGRVQIRHDKRNEQVPVGGLTRARLDVTLANADLLVETDKTLGSSIRSALGTSIEGLLWSMQLIIVGLCLVLPWALLIWAGWRWFGRRKTKPAPNVAPPAA